MTIKLHAAIRASGLFDEAYYAATSLGYTAGGTDLLDHYLTQGRTLGFSPSAEFDAAGYLALHPDVAAAGLEPLSHYVLRGRTENRRLSAVDLPAAGRDAALAKIRASGLFDETWYLGQVPLLRGTSIDPLLHYVIEGHRSFLEPHPNVSMRAWLGRSPNLRASGLNPLLDYLGRGMPAGPTVATASRQWLPDDGMVPLPDDAIQFEQMAGIAYLSQFRVADARASTALASRRRGIEHASGGSRMRRQASGRIDHPADLRRAGASAELPALGHPA